MNESSNIPPCVPNCADKLESEALLAPGAATTMLEEAIAGLREINRPMSTSKPDESGEQGLQEDISGMVINTAVPEDQLRVDNEALLQWPPGFTPSPKLERQLERRRSALGADGYD